MKCRKAADGADCALDTADDRYAGGPQRGRHQAVGSHGVHHNGFPTILRSGAYAVRHL